MLAFRNHGPDGRFIGELTDPMPIEWEAGGSALKVDVVAPSASSSAHPHRTALEVSKWHR